MIEILFYFIITIIIILFASLILAFIEKRVLAIFTKGLGANKPDFKGFLQPVADAIKFLIKEDCTPDTKNKKIYFAAPLIAICPTISAFCLIPFNNSNMHLNITPSIILILALVSIPFVGIFLAGFSSCNKFSFFASIRAVIQLISFEIPMSISILAVVFMAGSLNLNEIIQSQNGATWLFSWHFIPQIIGCIIFFICGLILLNCTQFDLSKIGNGLVSSYKSEYSGLKFALFSLNEYTLLFLISLFFVSLYFGGYLSPFGVYILPDFLIPLEQIFWLIFKTFFIIFLIFLTKITFSRLRYNRLLEFSYKILLPLSLINLNITILIQYFKGIN